MTLDLGHDEEIMAAFLEYESWVRWEERAEYSGLRGLHKPEPFVERAAARGRLVALIANLAAEALGVTNDEVAQPQLEGEEPR